MFLASILYPPKGSTVKPLWGSRSEEVKNGYICNSFLMLLLQMHYYQEKISYLCYLKKITYSIRYHKKTKGCLLILSL